MEIIEVTENYDHPIYEGGVQLVDMVYLQRRIWWWGEILIEDGMLQKERLVDALESTFYAIIAREEKI